MNAATEMYFWVGIVITFGNVTGKHISDGWEMNFGLYYDMKL